MRNQSSSTPRRADLRPLCTGRELAEERAAAKRSPGVIVAIPSAPASSRAARGDPVETAQSVTTEPTGSNAPLPALRTTKKEASGGACRCCRFRRPPVFAPGGERTRPRGRALLRDRRDQPVFFAFAASSTASAAASCSLRSATLSSGVRRRGLFGRRGLAPSSNSRGLSTPKTLCAPATRRLRKL